jgi:hypothetical protein
MRFRYTISHVPAKDLIIADALSRAPSRNIEKSESDFENDTTAFVDMIMESNYRITSGADSGGGRTRRAPPLKLEKI